MNRLALPPTDMFIGHRVLIGTSMGRDCSCRNNALAPLIPSLRAVWLTPTPERAWLFTRSRSAASCSMERVSRFIGHLLRSQSFEIRWNAKGTKGL